MRFPTALLFLFVLLLTFTSCDSDDDAVDSVTLIDCEAINTFDTLTCTVLNTADSTAYVNSFLGSWYLSASQNSGFGGGSTECSNFTESDSPFLFTFESDYTWRLIYPEVSVDTTLGWTVNTGFGGWRLSSTLSDYPAPSFSHLCDGNLVSDARPRDGSLMVFSRAD